MAKNILLLFASITFVTCSSPNQKEYYAMKKALTLYCSFDKTDCDFALGDKKLYTTEMSSRQDLSDDVFGNKYNGYQARRWKRVLRRRCFAFSEKKQACALL